MKRYLILCLFFGLIFAAYPQSDNTEWMDFIEELYGDDPDAAYIEHLYDELSFLAENPFNVQSVTKEDLERLPFLTAIQIENLLYYIYKYGSLVDLFELKNVEELDMQTIRYLLPFLYVGDTVGDKPLTDPKHLWKYSKQQVLVRTNFTVQEKAGYRKATDEEKESSPNKYYRGEPYYLSLRYNYNYKDRLQFGLTAEKDPGESFLHPEFKGFDHYAFNLSLRNTGIIEMFTLGDYRLAFGEGLVMNTDFTLGKTSDITNINRRRGGIKRHISTSESGYFRGVATTLKLNRLKASLFVSRKKEDANVEGNRIKTFQTNGYHRTFSELKKKNTAETDLWGAHVAWNNDRLNLGFTTVYYSFCGMELDPDPRPYNRYYLRGSDHLNLSVDYSYRAKRWLLQGEVAFDKELKFATIHNFLYYPTSFLDLIASIRHYDKAYNGLYAKSFSESSTVQNETGFYAGLKLHPFRYWEVAAYWDHFRFPGIKYGISTPSSGNDFLVQLFYYPRRHWQMNLRYRYKTKSKDTTIDGQDEKYVLPYDQHRLRYQMEYKLDPRWIFKTHVHYNLYHDTNRQQAGWSVGQSVSYTRPTWGIDASVAWFDTPDWNTRINVYEKNVLYAFSFPMYYGTGLRYYLNLKWQVAKPLTLYIKAGNTSYTDRDKIGSGLEEIDGKNKTDIYFLVKYKF